MIKKIKDYFFAASTLKLPLEPRGNWHVDFIVHLASVIKPKVYVELGLYQCELFNKVIPHAEKLIGVDFSEVAGQYMKRNSRTEFVWMKTEEFATLAKENGTVIDILFIDANHSYESVLEDFNNFFPLVRDQGIILLHDGYPQNIQQTASGYCDDGYRAIEELTANQKNFEMMTIPVAPGLTIARKKMAHLPWIN
jgi:predicted O-methyltransferase YrrM